MGAHVYLVAHQGVARELHLLSWRAKLAWRAVFAPVNYPACVGFENAEYGSNAPDLLAAWHGAREQKLHQATSLDSDASSQHDGHSSRSISGTRALSLAASCRIMSVAAATTAPGRRIWGVSDPCAR